MTKRRTLAQAHLNLSPGTVAYHDATKVRINVKDPTLLAFLKVCAAHPIFTRLWLTAGK